MHEFSLVDQIIASFLKTPVAQRLPTVRRMLVRYGPGLTEDSIRQAFQVQSAGTPLAGAQFDFEAIPVSIVCKCGAKVSPPEHEHDVPFAVCEDCAAVYPVPHFNVLEIVDAE